MYEIWQIRKMMGREEGPFSAGLSFRRFGNVRGLRSIYDVNPHKWTRKKALWERKDNLMFIMNYFAVCDCNSSSCFENQVGSDRNTCCTREKNLLENGIENLF